MYYSMTNSLYHHGISGQKWGQKNGPPYPLKRGIAGKIQKAIYNHKQKKEEKKAEEHEKLVNSVSAKGVALHKGEFSNEELEKIYTRLQTEQKISKISSENTARTLKSVSDNAETLSSIAKTGINMYNMLAGIHNSGVTDESKKWSAIDINAKKKSQAEIEKEQAEIRKSKAEAEAKEATARNTRAMAEAKEIENRAANETFDSRVNATVAQNKSSITKAQADADTATANARKASADADKSEAESREADATSKANAKQASANAKSAARQTRAEAAKAEANARKASAEADKTAAEARKSSAEADKVEIANRAASSKIKTNSIALDDNATRFVNDFIRSYSSDTGYKPKHAAT